MRIATWNVNSMKARLGRVEEWIRDVEPDVLCVQETKLADAAFPSLAFEALGYRSAHHGEGRWNGVAIISKLGLDDVITNFAVGDPDPDARIITARCGGVLFVNVYVPNGRALDHDHYRYKLRWLTQLREHLDAVTTAQDQVIVTGDFNVAPADIDVYDPEQFVDATHVSEPERAALRHLSDWGLIDVFRDRYPQERLFSWWDYRGGSFHMGRGMRIDLVLATTAVAERVTWAVVDRNARKGESPSDHAPVVVDLN